MLISRDFCRPLRAGLLFGTFLGGLGLAQTSTPQTPPAAPTTTTPAKPATPVSSAATTKSSSAIAIEVSALVKGQLVQCPAAYKLSPRAVCLYVKSSGAVLRPLIKGKLAGRAVGEWKVTGRNSTLIVTESVGGSVGAVVLVSALADTESLVVVEAVQPKASSTARVAAPAGVVKGEPYVLDRDLIGVVSVTSLGNNKFRLTADGSSPLTITVGQKAAQNEGGNVELPLVPSFDGKNLLFPLSGLRALGCTATPSGGSLTVACGKNSVGLKPIVF